MNQETELLQAKQDAKQHGENYLRALRERNEARRGRDLAIAIGVSAVETLRDHHYAIPKEDRTLVWDYQADILDRIYRRLQVLDTK